MKLFRVLVLAVALVAGGIAAYLALNMGPGAPTPTVVELAPADPVAGCARRGSRYRPGPEAHGGERALAALARRRDESDLHPEADARRMPWRQLQGSVVRSQFVAGEPIREMKLARPESGFLSAILPRASAPSQCASRRRTPPAASSCPNDRVDVIQTISQQTNADVPAENVSRTILANIKVLAIDQTVDEEDGEAVVVGKTATLELDPAQVELITSAEASGTLSLALRSPSPTPTRW